MSLRLRLPDPWEGAWDDLLAEFDVPAEFPPDVLAEAAAVVEAPPATPAVDRTDVPFLTLDPEGSRDLDQALHLERSEPGYVLRYAIADVAAFVRPGGAIDAEAHRRGETVYGPGRRAPLHPPVLSEGAASLLPDQDRPAVLWTIALDAEGESEGWSVERALVRSRRQLDYAGVQAEIDAGTADEQLILLREVGSLLETRAAERGAVDLPALEQEVGEGPNGRPVLTLRAPLPAEGWNAQLSLLTGRVAAALMLGGGRGLLRTMPDPNPESIASLRRSAQALGVPWPEGASWAAVVSGLDPHTPAQAALITLATRLLRGAGYTVVEAGLPQHTHAGVAATYAHCTAPLRRLADRYVSEVCLALCAGTDVPTWVTDALPALPAEMAASGRRTNSVERAVVDLAEAVLLAPCVGEEFDAVVVDVNPSGGVVQLSDPPVRASCDGADLPLGERLRVRLENADPGTRTVRFVPADGR